MRYWYELIIISGMMAMMMGCATDQIGEEGPRMIHLVPRPEFMQMGNGCFELTEDTAVLFEDAEAEPVADYLIDLLEPATGYGLEKARGTDAERSNGIVLRLRPSKKPAGTAPDRAGSSEMDVDSEAYELKVTPAAIEISASGAPGLFYGVQTLRQLLPPAIESPSLVSGLAWTVPAVEIRDAPRYPWRGMMLDVSRHFFPKEFVKQFIDYLAMHKLNRFHWHLVDDQGWRIEIENYPLLTKIGAWRKDQEHLHWNAREKQKPGEKATYGGFYTQDEIREIVKYARSRFITIVPEIEMPAHVTASLAAYPELSCTGGPFTVPPGGVWPITDIYCAGNDKVFAFLKDVLDEVMALFPGEFIHVGGDEATKTEWKKCAKCQDRIRAEGLKDEEELQSYFIRRMEQFLLKKGRRLIGWDEILEGGLAPEATVMSWRGMEGGIEAARQGHYVVMSPTTHCYFDYYQGDPDVEPLAIGGFLPLKKVYSFEPTPAELTPEEGRYILGGQANLWTEYIATPSHAEYMTFPRIAALSEVVWSKKAHRDWDDFTERMTTQLERYEAGGIHFAKSAFQVNINAGSDLQKKELRITLETEIPLPEIRYTLDGGDPSPDAPRYEGPFTLDRSAQLKAGSFLNGKLLGKTAEKTFSLHKATARPVKLAQACSPRYPGGGEFGLTDSLRGTKNFRDGYWKGFKEVDLEAVIELGEVTTLSRLATGFLQNVGSWIFMPTEVEYSVSMDGKGYETVALVKNDVPEKSGEPMVKDFAAELSNVKARFVKVRAKNRGTCPAWHQGAGNPCWIFVDEIVVE
jgi:hexosaminidase